LARIRPSLASLWLKTGSLILVAERGWRTVRGDFLAAVVLVVTLGAGYWTAAAEGKRRTFWLLVLLAALFAFARWCLPRIRARVIAFRALLRAGRDYSRVLAVAGQHQARADEIQELLNEATAALGLRFADGVAEGRRRVVGEVLGGSGTALTPIAIGLPDDELAFAATATGGSPVELGSLWQLRVRGVGTLVAVLRVADVVNDEDVILRVDHARAPDLVDGLRIRAQDSTDFPASLEIAARGMTSIRDFEQEA